MQGDKLVGIGGVKQGEIWAGVDALGEAPYGCRPQLSRLLAVLGRNLREGLCRFIGWDLAQDEYRFNALFVAARRYGSRLDYRPDPPGVEPRQAGVGLEPQSPVGLAPRRYESARRPDQIASGFQ